MLGVCVLSAGIGSGVTLLAQEGPPGPRGERGPRGPAGPEGPEGSVDLSDVDVGSLEGKLTEIEELVEDLEGLGIDLGELDLSGSGLSELCETVGIC